MFTGIFKFFIALNSNQKPSALAIGIGYGFWLALLPLNSLLWIVLLLLSGFTKMNQAAVLIFGLLFKLLVGPFTPLLDGTGWWILSQPGLYELFTSWQNMPIVPWTRFYNSIVMGSLALGPLLAAPVAVLAYFAVVYYRKQVRDRVLKSQFIQKISKIPLVSSLIAKYNKVKDIVSLVS